MHSGSFVHQIRTYLLKAADVCILPALVSSEPYSAESFLFVETTINERGEETNIDHVSNGCREDGGNVSKRAIAQSLPFTHKVALEWAVSFAALNGIPIVYERVQVQAPAPPMETPVIQPAA